MAGYSGTPLLQKLGVRAGTVLALVNAPRGIERTLGPLPDDVWVRSLDEPPLGIVLLFANRRAELESGFGRAASALAPAGGLWVAWPKRASGVPTDLTEDVVRGIGLAAGLVDTKVCAIDGVWSGLRFVVRRADRERRAAAIAADTPLTRAALQ
jgi:hypothetical protein